MVESILINHSTPRLTDFIQTPISPISATYEISQIQHYF
ncbi:hypothetical protein ZOSMA_72G00090 [Zostera marina]|uniref:Uncharacterized protein n=1 Tax=Zostera marina TaxID=29655 RepID=A0A0K9NRZ8_ZOSMR|nr:hypothetical protein ZOSMA_72G00090 [Zostera marina]